MVRFTQTPTLGSRSFNLPFLSPSTPGTHAENPGRLWLGSGHKPHKRELRPAVYRSPVLKARPMALVAAAVLLGEGLPYGTPANPPRALHDGHAALVRS